MGLTLGLGMLFRRGFGGDFHFTFLRPAIGAFSAEMRLGMALAPAEDALGGAVLALFLRDPARGVEGGGEGRFGPEEGVEELAFFAPVHGKGTVDTGDAYSGKIGCHNGGRGGG